jgi:hypothetical protein
MNKNTASTSPVPAYGVREWAKHKVNIQNGCEHDCRYCYAKSYAVRFHRATPKAWCQPSLLTKAIEKGYHKRDGRTMMPTSHDITPRNLSENLIVLQKLLQAGNEVLIVSKPHLACVQKLCAELQDFKKQVLFRFTVGSADDMVLRFWEPGAPAFGERMVALRWAHQQGFATSISCEPMLDLRIADVIVVARPYVTDAIWLGRVNNLRTAIALNCPGDAEALRKADQLLAEQTDDFLRELYEQYKADPLIKYKDSIKKVVGLARPTEVGLDV